MVKPILKIVYFFWASKCFNSFVQRKFTLFYKISNKAFWRKKAWDFLKLRAWSRPENGRQLNQTSMWTIFKLFGAIQIVANAALIAWKLETNRVWIQIRTILVSVTYVLSRRTLTRLTSPWLCKCRDIGRPVNFLWLTWPLMNGT